jgi:hypothetical protein
MNMLNICWADRYMLFFDVTSQKRVIELTCLVNAAAALFFMDSSVQPQHLFFSQLTRNDSSY